MTSGMEDRHATDPTSKRREPLFVSNHHHLWLSRCSVLCSFSPSSSFSYSLIPFALCAFCHPRPSFAACTRSAGALKAAVACIRNRAKAVAGTFPMRPTWE